MAIRRLLPYLLFFLATAGLGYFAIQLSFDANIERLFPDDDPELAYFNGFREAFSNENEYLGIALANDAGIFHSEFLTKVDSLGRQLERLPQVERVSGLTLDRFLRIGPLGTRLERPLVRVNPSSGYAADSAFLFALPLFPETYFSKDGRSTCLYLKIPSEVAYGPQGDTLLEQVKLMVKALQFDAFYLTGGFYSAKVQERQLRGDMLKLSAVSLFLILLAFALAFRSVKMVILPVITILVATVWTLGMMALFGGELNLMTILLPPIIFVVGSSDIIHLNFRYQEALREGMEKAKAIRHAVREVGRATFLTSCTTAAGFLSLAFVGVPPVRQLGIFGALGVMLTLGLTLVLLPAGWRLLSTQAIEKDRFWPSFLEGLFHSARKYHRMIGLCCLGLLLAAFAGISQLQVQSYFTEELPFTGREGQEMDFFESQYGGLRPFALGISVGSPERDIFDPAVIRELNKLDDFLRNTYGVRRLASMVNYFKSAHCSLNNGDPSAFSLPRSDSALAYLIDRSYEYGRSHGVFDDWVTEDGRSARVAGSLPDLGLLEWEQRNSKLEEFVRQELDSSLVQVTLTGAAHLIDRSHRLISVNMLKGLAVALIMVALLMGLLYRSWRMLCIALLVNLWPLALVAGLMGLADIGLKMSTAIIFTIAFGIAVDDTIHFLSRYLLEQKRGLSAQDALHKTYLSTGKAILVTSLILTLGFGTLLLSVFPGTQLTGLLIGLTLVLAVWADLLWLPALLTKRKEA